MTADISRAMGRLRRSGAASTLASTWARGVFRVVILMAHDSVRPHMGCLQAPASRQLGLPLVSFGSTNLNLKPLGSCMNRRSVGETGTQRAYSVPSAETRGGGLVESCGVCVEVGSWKSGISHFRFSGRGMYRFPKKCYLGKNGQH